MRSICIKYAINTPIPYDINLSYGSNCDLMISNVSNNVNIYNTTELSHK